MKKELKDKWTTALRSGDYKQTAGVLKDERGFCCLGVLADIVEPNGWVTGARGYFFRKGLTLLDDITLIQVGLSFNESTMFAGYNDMGYDFNHIANLIEEKI